MIRIHTHNGWIELTEVQVIVTLKDLTPFQTAGAWVDFCERRPTLKKEGRVHCQMCGMEWAKVHPDHNTYFIQTTEGNKIVCGYCINKIQAPEIRSQRNHTKELQS